MCSLPLLLNIDERARLLTLLLLYNQEDFLLLQEREICVYVLISIKHSSKRIFTGKVLTSAMPSASNHIQCAL